jgi:hypothetical protein
MTEVSSVEGTVVDSLSLDYVRGDISSYQHEFTKPPIARGTGANSIALGYNAAASGAYSIALGYNAKASGLASIALGYNAAASGYYSTALGDGANASGYYSTALGDGATATRDYQITIGTKFVYFRFASTETQATVYSALSPWLNPTAPSSQGAMGSFGTAEVVRLYRPDSTAIRLYDINGNVKTIYYKSTNQMGDDIAICTVKY